MENRSEIRFENVPPPLQETLDWLVSVEDFDTLKRLSSSIFSRLPRENARSTDFYSYYLMKARDYRSAARVALETVRLMPGSPDVRFNAGKCLNAAGDPEAAERMAREALRDRPDWTDAQLELAVYVAMQGRNDEAMAMFEAMRARMPETDRNRDVVDFNMGWHQVRDGRFKEGMRNLAKGRKLKIWGARSQPQSAPILDPSVSLRDKIVLLCGEGGAGDEMINVRFARTIRERGGRAYWYSRQKLDSVFGRIDGLEGTVTERQLHSGEFRFHYWAPCMDLPVLLDLDQSEVPALPYLSAEPSRASAWADRLKGDGFRIGIRWKGNARYEQDLFRSVPFELLEQLASVPGVSVYSLQKDEGAEDRPAGSRVKDLAPLLTDWEETAAAIAGLDLVVSSCTSVAHLAAAMGKPTWLMCPMNSYYIWAPPGDRSRWYPSVRLYRQTSLHRWDEPFARLMSDLKRKLEGEA